MSESITITGDNLSVEGAPTLPHVPILGVNIEPIGYWRGSTPFSNLMRQAKPGSNIIVQKQPHLAGYYPAEAAGIELNGAIPINEESALSAQRTAVERWPGQVIFDDDLPEDTPTVALTWASAARRFGGLRFNATALQLNEPETAGEQNLTATYGGKAGISPNGMVDLCQAAHAVPWYGPGHKWSDLSIAAQATTMSRTVPGYWELGNEPWNGSYHFSDYLMAQAGGDFKASLELYVEMAINAYGVAVAAGCQSILALNAQFTNPWTGAVMLEKAASLMPEHGPGAIAVAPYFGGSYGRMTAGDLAAMSDDAIFNQMAAEVVAQGDRVREWKTIADAHAVRLVAYEGGPHLFPIGALRNDEASVERLNALMKDARMECLIRDHYQVWLGAGGGDYFAFVLSGVDGKNGNGAIADFTQLDPLDTPAGRGWLA